MSGGGKVAQNSQAHEVLKTCSSFPEMMSMFLAKD